MQKTPAQMLGISGIESKPVNTPDDWLLEEYETWHKAKGYWPNETPMGVAKA